MANTRNSKLNRGDFISLLPDDILLNILSKLSIKEQARTGILSSRWTHLWTFNSCLNIDAEDFVQRDADSRVRTLKFIDTANQILTMHKGQPIDELKITFPVDCCLKLDDNLKVDSWINIAKQRQVKAIYLDFRIEYSKPYGFELFSLTSTIFPSLVTLRLENTFVSDSIIHGLLSNSPNLLELSIINCYGILLCPKISGSSLKLKYLELIGNKIAYLKIYAPNLVSFTFCTERDAYWPKRIYFKNIPLLTRLSCSLACMLRDWRDFCPLLPQLNTLTLNLSKKLQVGHDTPNFPVLVNLRQLHLKLLFKDDSDGRLSLLQGLFRASPHLCGLSFDLGPYIPKHNLIESFPDHKFLEELVIHNFKGFEYEVQLVTCIAESCSSLQEIMIHLGSYKREVEQESVDCVVKKLEALKFITSVHDIYL